MFKKITIICLFLFFAPSLFAVGPLKIGIYSGLSTPFDDINRVYNQQEVTIENLGNGSFFYNAVSLGYHVGADSRIEITPLFDISFGISYNSFPESVITIYDANNKSEKLVELFTNQNIVPITGGFNLNILPLNLINVYVMANLSYSIIMNTVNYPLTDKYPLSIPLSENSRTTYFTLEEIQDI